MFHAKRPCVPMKCRSTSAWESIWLLHVVTWWYSVHEPAVPTLKSFLWIRVLVCRRTATVDGGLSADGGPPNAADGGPQTSEVSEFREAR